MLEITDERLWHPKTICRKLFNSTKRRKDRIRTAVVHALREIDNGESYSEFGW